MNQHHLTDVGGRLMVGLERKRLRTIPMPRPVLIRRAIKILLIVTTILFVPLFALCGVLLIGMYGLTILLVEIPITIVMRRLGTSISRIEQELGFNYHHYETLIIASLGKILGSRSERTRVLMLVMALTGVTLLLCLPIRYTQATGLVLCITGVALGSLALYTGVSIPLNRWIEGSWIEAQQLGIANKAEICPECDGNVSGAQCGLCGLRVPSHPDEMKWYFLKKTPSTPKMRSLKRKVSRSVFSSWVSSILLMFGTAILCINPSLIPVLIFSLTVGCCLGFSTSLWFIWHRQVAILSAEIGHDHYEDRIVRRARKTRNYPKIGIQDLEEMERSYDLPLLLSFVVSITLIVLGILLWNGLVILTMTIPLFAFVKWFREASRLYDDSTTLEFRDELMNLRNAFKQPSE